MMVTIIYSHLLAFAIVEAERRDSWSWFFRNLQIALGEPRHMTIVSDRQKGLLPTMEEVIPNAHHCYCKVRDLTGLIGPNSRPLTRLFCYYYD